MYFTDCLLHIGLEKTGTTTIQQFLARNRSLLRRRGWLVPESLGPSDHRALVSYVANDNRRTSYRIREGYIGAEKLGAMRASLVKDFRAEVQKVPSGSRLLLTHEHFHDVVRTREELDRLKDFLRPYVETIRIVVYLRPQHELAISHYSTHLRTGGLRERPLPDADPADRYYDYDQILSFWSDHFGEDNIIVRRYDRHRFPLDDIRRDILSLLGEDEREFQFPESINESLKPAAQQFLLHINRHLPRFVDGKVNPLRGRLVQHLEEGRLGQGMLPSADEARAFYEAFAASNERVRQRWFPEATCLFEPDFTHFPDGPPNYQLSMEEAFEIFAELWSKQSKERSTLRDKLARMRKFGASLFTGIGVLVMPWLLF